MRHLVYVLGSPGAGKSSLARELVKGQPVLGTTTKPFAHTIYPHIIQLGVERPGGVPGTDSLAMGVLSRVRPWLRDQCVPLILGEGDRLANARFFDAVNALGYLLHVVYLDVPEEVAQQRRQERGSHQNPTWVAGRVSKHRRLSEMYGALVLDGTRPVAELAAQLRSSPELRLPAGASI